MNTKTKRILLILGLVVLCLAVISTVSAGYTYSHSECKQIALDYAHSHLKSIDSVEMGCWWEEEPGLQEYTVFVYHTNDAGQHVCEHYMVNEHTGQLRVGTPTIFG